MKRLLYVLTAMILLTSNVSALGAAAPEQTVDSQLIEDMILYYGGYGEAAAGEIDDLLGALKQTDSRKGKLWESIMDYWGYVNTDLVINTVDLPESLPTDDSLAIILLGGALNADGSMRDELIERLKVGLVCAAQYPSAYVVCTGGGTAKENKDVTEAGQMGAWLVENGLDENRLILEDRSLSTIENAQYTLDILHKDYPRIHSVVIVSSDYHIARGSLLFETTMLMRTDEKEAPEVHVISNCASPSPDKSFTDEYLRRWQMYNMLQLIGDRELAQQYLKDPRNFPWPVLHERIEFSDAA